MYVLKQKPEDFVVSELGSPQPSGSGPFAYFLLHKKGWNTIGALEAIAAKLNVSLQQFSSAGNKDKQAVTEQVCSARHVSRDALEKLSIKDITITYLGQAGQPVSLGLHAGNSFKITVRHLDTEPTFHERFVNLYGGQRFSAHNTAIGRAIVRNDFESVVEHLSHDAERGPIIRDALEKHPNNWLGALRHFPKTLLTLFVHAYQSQLWNDAASALTQEKDEDVLLPIVGFGTTKEQLVEFPVLQQQLDEEGITPRDFIIKSFPQLSAEGGMRDLYCTAHHIQVEEFLDDELNKGKKKITVSFDLPKGSYATEFIRQAIGTL